MVEVLTVEADIYLIFFLDCRVDKSKLNNSRMHQYTIYTVMFFSKKLSLLGSWKSSSVSISRLKHKVSWITVHERAASVINDKQALVDRTWEPWVTYIKAPLSSSQL